MSRYIITGGFGSGKTSVIDVLRSRVSVEEEPARALIREHAAVTGDGSRLDRMPEVFVDRLVARAVTGFAAHSDGTVTVFDRGIPDCIAYADIYGLDTRTARVAATRYRYAEPVFLAPPWEEIYTTDELRQASFDQATVFYERIVAIYEELDYETEYLPKAPVADRVDFIGHHLGF